MSIPNKQFVIGIGSQRAGSTLLHTILKSSTKIYMHPSKELHYFDTLYNVRPIQTLRDHSIENIEREILNIQKNDCEFLHSKLYQNYLLTNFYCSFKNIEDISYIDLYRPCIMENTHLGEVTPEYMLLPEEGIINLKQTVGENAKIILIMREPIQRTLSALKLLNVYEHLHLNNKGISDLLFTFINNNSSWLLIQDEFNNYKKAIELYSSHFSNLLVLKFEEFSNEQEQLRIKLENFLDIEVNTESFHLNIKSKKNTLGESFKMNKKNIDMLSERYKNEITFYKNYQ